MGLATDLLKILLKNQGSCIINGVSATKYFKLVKDLRQGNSAYAYLFILVLEMVFLSMKEYKIIRGLIVYQQGCVNLDCQESNF